VSVNEDEEFPTASTIKIQILAQVLRRAEAGKLDLSRKMALTPELRVPGSGVITYFDDVAEMTMRDVANLMILVSDNTATNLCIDWATYEGTNQLIRDLGFTRTILRRKMQDHASVREGNENITTPTEMAGFMEVLWRGEKLSKFVCSETLRILAKPKRGMISPGLPADVVVAHKTGGMEKVRNDVGIVYLKRRPYIVSVFTKYGQSLPVDQERLITDISRAVHQRMAVLDVTSQYGQGIPATFLK